ncbi:M23 family metallopeptidase [Streptomyces pactum]|uniref:M23 family metallopeptidase n=1 Tax=Streptomyces pactum TaxID=68249 RepID=A0ABS0NKG1_9ACTN|nr:M23 family metallopeptidase [Streptomyces pactum]MBH5335677.1 M23 family metallopeptidase [Streptomyces pactum]
MRKHITTRIASTSALRTRAAVVGMGMGATVALGAGVALAVDSPSSDHRPVAAAEQQADAAKKAESVKQAEAAKKAEAAEQAAAAKKAAAERAEKAEAAKKASRDHKRAPVKKAEHKPAAKPAHKPKPSSWTAPLNKYTLGSTFGLAGSHWAHNHSGQDFVVPTGTAVKAAHAGTVVKAGPNGGGDGPAYGNAIVIRHGAQVYTQYAHLSKINVHVGQAVGKGQQIGLSGSTGNSTGPHLHFEVRTTPNYGTAVEPVHFLRSHGAL